MANPETIANILTLLSAAYPSAKLADETPDLYERLLADIPDDILEAATLDHISKSPFYPHVSDLRERAFAIKGDFHRLPPAAQAWGEITKLIITFGRSNKPDIENPISARVVEALGWRELCMSENQVSDRARFIQAYDQYIERERNEQQTLPSIKALSNRLSMPGLKPGRIEASDE